MKAWLGDPDGALHLVEQHIQADQVSHPYRSQIFICRRTLGQAIAWAGDFPAAAQYALESDISDIRERFLLDSILDFSSEEEGVAGEAQPLSGHLISSQFPDLSNDQQRLELRAGEPGEVPVLVPSSQDGASSAQLPPELARVVETLTHL